MPDLATIGAALSSLKTATDIVKFLRESDVSLERAELKLKLADLLSSLADAKIELIEVQETLLEKDKKLQSLKMPFTRRILLCGDTMLITQPMKTETLSVCRTACAAGKTITSKGSSFITQRSIAFECAHRAVINTRGARLKISNRQQTSNQLRKISS